MSPKPWENAEGYADPTAYNAIKKVSAEGHEALDAKVNTLIKVLKFIIAESGFELAARIELRDRKTGRFFRRQPSQRFAIAAGAPVSLNVWTPFTPPQICGPALADFSTASPVTGAHCPRKLTDGPRFTAWWCPCASSWRWSGTCSEQRCLW